MKMVKQKPTTDGTTAMDCGVCVVAMLTDLPYEKILSDVPQYRTTPDYDWARYLSRLGFQVERVDENAPPPGRRHFCVVRGKASNGEVITHAIAIDELGHIFDPANGVRELGTLTLKQCVAHGIFEICSCFAVSDRETK
jgi:hypothetical protein